VDAATQWLRGPDGCSDVYADDIVPVFELTLAPEVRVNEIAPGWIATAFAEEAMDPVYRANVEAATPLGRFGQVNDVAQAAVFLLSDEAAFITGQTLKVNGGLSS
jgi:3-oxoacyl-[acyl-carrier protein] reductase